jgi:hypothetical protein
VNGREDSEAEAPFVALASSGFEDFARTLSAGTKTGEEGMFALRAIWTEERRELTDLILAREFFFLAGRMVGLVGNVSFAPRSLGLPD